MLLNLFKIISQTLSSTTLLGPFGGFWAIYFFSFIIMISFFYVFDKIKYEKFVKYASVLVGSGNFSKFKRLRLCCYFFLWWLPIFLIGHCSVGPKIFGPLLIWWVFDFSFVPDSLKITTFFYYFYLLLGWFFAIVYQSNKQFKDFIINNIYFGCSGLDDGFHFFFNSDNIHIHFGKKIGGTAAFGITALGCGTYIITTDNPVSRRFAFDEYKRTLYEMKKMEEDFRGSALYEKAVGGWKESPPIKGTSKIPMDINELKDQAKKIIEKPD